MITAPIHVVAIGGGGGVAQVLKAVQPFAERRTAIIAVTDTGRSTGLARTIGGIPAPGDLRATIAAFAGDRLIAELLQHRFSAVALPELEGMAFGNLLIAALAQVTGDFGSAIEHVARMADCTVRVLPISTADTQLCAELADGTVREGELAVRGVHKPPIVRLFLRDTAKASPAVLEAIACADLVVLGPGSLFTTVLANLLFADVIEALRTTPGKVVYICNTTTQPGQTDGYRVTDHVRRVVEMLTPGVLDVALINRSAPDPLLLRQYETEGLFLLQPDDHEIALIRSLGVEPIVRDLTEQITAKRALWNKQDTIRHDPQVLGAVLSELLSL